MMSIRIQKVAFAVVPLLFFLASSVFAQTSKGSISGDVTDARGAFIAGAAITATNHNTGEARTAATGGLGQYRIDALEPGIYSVAVTQKGFAPMILDKVSVSGSVVTSVNAKLAVGGEDQTIIVEASGAAVQTESGEVSQTISASEIRDIPNDSLNPYALAMLCSGSPPTVTPSLAKAVLHDTVSANRIVGLPFPQGAPLSLARVLWLPGSR